MVIQSINEIINFCAVTALIIILILSIFATDLRQRVNTYFFLLVAFLLLSFLFDALVELMIGYTSPLINILIRVFDCMSYSTAGLQIIAFGMYLYEYLRLKTSVSKKPFITINIIGVGIILISIIASFLELYVRFDEHNNYIRQSTYWIAYVCLALAILICLIIVLQHAKTLKKLEWGSLVIYLTVPIIGYVFENMIPDFYVAAAGASLTTFLIYLNIQVDLKSQLQLKESELIENRIAIMFSQIQPHFLFNSLSAIENLCDIDIDKTKMAINDFAHYLRGNLEAIGQNKLISFENELEHIETYLSLEKLRFGDKLNIVYDINVSKFCLPPLTVQPIVENAVRHGINKSAKGGTVTISSSESDTAFYIKVVDDGVGFDKSEVKDDGRIHVGIKNVSGRLAAQCSGKLEISSVKDIGTNAVITIPK